MSDVYSESINYLNALADKNNAWSAQQAQNQMNFQLYTSNTAHQREVADLKAAGLNPILSAGGQGAQSMSGSSAQADNSLLPAVVNILGKAVDANSAAAASGLAQARQGIMSQMADLIKSKDGSADGASDHVKLNWSASNWKTLVGNMIIRAVEGFTGKNFDDTVSGAGSKAGTLYDSATGRSGKSVSEALKDVNDSRGFHAFTSLTGATLPILYQLITGEDLNGNTLRSSKSKAYDKRRHG